MSRRKRSLLAPAWRKEAQMRSPATTRARRVSPRISVLLFAVIMLPFSHAVSSAAAAVQTASETVSIARDPADVLPRIGDRPPSVVLVTFTAREVEGIFAPVRGTAYRYWRSVGTALGPGKRKHASSNTTEITMGLTKGEKT